MGANQTILDDVKTAIDFYSIKDHVRKIIQPYIDKPTVQGKIVSVPFLKDISLPLDQYVYLMHRVLYKYSVYNVMYISLLYKLAKIDTRKNFCGVIYMRNYYYIDDSRQFFKDEDGTNFRYIWIESEKKYIDVRNVDTMDIGVNTDIYKMLIAEIIRQYNNPECEFISMLLNLNSTPKSGHANMFLIIKDPPSHVRFIMYEPHGSWGTCRSSRFDCVSETANIYKDMKLTFLKLITRVFSSINVTSEVVNTGIISCPKGIQSTMKDRLGYCTIISIFWLYIFLSLMNYYGKDYEGKEKLFANLLEIEKSIYSLTENNHEKLYSVVVNFTYDFLSAFYITNLVPEPGNVNLEPREVTERYYRQLEKEAPATLSIMDGKYYSTDPNSVDSKYKSFVKEFIKQYNQRDNLKKIHSVQKPKRQRKIPVQPVESSTHVRKKLGKCKVHSDCISDKCIAGMCKPPKDYNRRFPKYNSRQTYFRSVIDPGYNSAAEDSSSEDSGAEDSRAEDSGAEDRRLKGPKRVFKHKLLAS